MTVNCEIDGTVGVVTLAKPPHNLLDDALLEDLMTAYDKVVVGGAAGDLAAKFDAPFLRRRRGSILWHHDGHPHRQGEIQPFFGRDGERPGADRRRAEWGSPGWRCGTPSLAT